MNKSISNSYPSSMNVSVSHYFLFIFLTLYLISGYHAPRLRSSSHFYLLLYFHHSLSDSFPKLELFHFPSLSQLSTVLSLQASKQKASVFSPIFTLMFNFYSNNYYLLDIQVVGTHGVFLVKVF